MTNIIYACSYRSLLFVPWHIIAHASHVSPCPQSLMDMGRMGAALVATRLKGSLNPCTGQEGISEGIDRWDRWDISILTVHSTEEENILWSQQASLPLGSAATSRLLVLKE